MNGQEQAGDPTQQDLARFWQALHDRPPRICGGRWQQRGCDSAKRFCLPKNEPETNELAAKKSQAATASREQHLSSGILADFDDNVISGLRR
jgi:hypothetical protein